MTAHTIDFSNIRHCEIKTARDALFKKLYPLEYPDLFDERCVVCYSEREYRGQKFVIPCIEIYRAFLMMNSFLANRLLTTGGLSDMFVETSWKRDRRTIQFDFMPRIIQHIPKELVPVVAAIHEIPALKNMWESVYPQYVQGKPLETKIPTFDKLTLICTIKTYLDYSLITHISGIDFGKPFDSITYGPELEKKARDSARGNDGTRTIDDGKEDVYIGPSSVSAQTGYVKEIGVLPRSIKRLDKIQVERKRSTGNEHSHVKVWTKKTDTTDLYSPNDQVPYGDLPAVDLQPNTEADASSPDASIQVLLNEPDFKRFGHAIEEVLRRSSCKLKSVQCEELPSRKKYAYISASRKRKYAAVEVSCYSNDWLIIELSLDGDYSISTLFIKCNGIERVQLVRQMLSKLDDANGHWSKECFPKSMSYRTLDHHSNRTISRWAELIFSKMR